MGSGHSLRHGRRNIGEVVVGLTDTLAKQTGILRQCCSRAKCKCRKEHAISNPMNIAHRSSPCSVSGLVVFLLVRICPEPLGHGGMGPIGPSHSCHLVGGETTMTAYRQFAARIAGSVIGGQRIDDLRHFGDLRKWNAAKFRMFPDRVLAVGQIDAKSLAAGSRPSRGNASSQRPAWGRCRKLQVRACCIHSNSLFTPNAFARAISASV